MEPKRRLKNIDVQFISLVDKGANQKFIIYKSDAVIPKDPTLTKQIQISKINEDKHMVYGIVYSPEETDSQGDVASALEIEKAAYAFMRNARVDKIDKQHNEDTGEGFVAESWITKSVDALFPSDPVGSWAVGIKIEKEETWQQIKKGEITGLSLMGRASTEEATKKTLFQKILEKLHLSKGFAETMAESMTKRFVWDLLDAFGSSVSEAFQDEAIVDKKDALLKSIDEMRAYVSNNFDEVVQKDLSDLEKEGRVLSTKNTTAVKGAIKALQNLLRISQSSIQKLNEEPEMTPEELKQLADDVGKQVTETLKPEIVKMIDDKLKPIQDAQAGIDTRVKKFEESPGSSQMQGQETDLEKGKDKDKEVRPIFT